MCVKSEHFSIWRIPSEAAFALSGPFNRVSETFFSSKKSFPFPPRLLPPPNIKSSLFEIGIGIVKYLRFEIWDLRAVIVKYLNVIVTVEYYPVTWLRMVRWKKFCKGKLTMPPLPRLITTACIIIIIISIIITFIIILPLPEC